MRNATIKFCCKDMNFHVYLLDQEEILDNGDVEDKVIYYSSRFNEYGIPLYDKSRIIINYCPWCGEKFPESLRDEWLEILWGMGYDSPFEDDIPEEYKTWDWWKKKKS